MVLVVCVLIVYILLYVSLPSCISLRSVLSFIVYGTGLTTAAPIDQVYLFHSALEKLAFTKYSARPHPGE